MKTEQLLTFGPSLPSAPGSCIFDNPGTRNFLLLVGLAFRFLFAYDTPMDKQREDAALLIAASIVAAIRLRGEKVAPTPKVAFIIGESIEIARMVWRRIQRGA